jgi:hypothetical protein
VGTTALRIDNGVRDTALDWATFLCEYSFFYPPVAEGEVDALPGMNVAYRRSALARVSRETPWWRVSGKRQRILFCAEGGKFRSMNAMKMIHCKKFSFELFTRQRYIYSRYYAGIRFRRRDVLRRCGAALLSFALPPLL